MRRFINADDFDVLHATPGQFTDKNLFAYCDNNPVMRGDNGGEFWHVLAGAVAGGVIGAVTNAVTEIGKSVITGQSVNWSEAGKGMAPAITKAASTAISRYRRESFRYFTNSFGDGFVSSFSLKFSSEYSKLILR